MQSDIEMKETHSVFPHLFIQVQLCFLVTYFAQCVVLFACDTNKKKREKRLNLDEVSVEEEGNKVRLCCHFSDCAQAEEEEDQLDVCFVSSPPSSPLFPAAV